MSVRQLTIAGFDKQAKAVFREMLETGDFAIVFLDDLEFVNTYFDSPESNEEAARHWEKHLRPKKIHLRIVEIEKTYFRDHPGFISQFTRPLYAKLSKSSHVDFVGLLIGGASSGLDGDYGFNIGGRIGPETQGTLSDLCLYLHRFIAILCVILSVRHGWRSDSRPAAAALASMKEISMREPSFRA